jgi:hypothetical protein
VRCRTLRGGASAVRKEKAREGSRSKRHLLRRSQPEQYEYDTDSSTSLEVFPEKVNEK